MAKMTKMAKIKKAQALEDTSRVWQLTMPAACVAQNGQAAMLGGIPTKLANGCAKSVTQRCPVGSTTKKKKVRRIVVKTKTQMEAVVVLAILKCVWAEMYRFCKYCMARRTCLRAIFQTFRTLCAQTALENFDNIVWHMCMMRATWVNA